MNQKAATETFVEIYGREPLSRDMVCHDGETVLIFQTGKGWEPLCPVQSGRESERLEFEIFPNLIIESDPQGLFEVLLVAQGVSGKAAVETASCFFRILAEAEWDGPEAQKPGKRPGTVYISRDTSSEQFPVEDIRGILDQMRRESFNGWLECPVIEDSGNRVWRYFNAMTANEVTVAGERDDDKG